MAEGYRNYYDLEVELLQDYFQDPYATAIPEYFDGSLSNGEINELLTNDISEYLTAEFIENPEDPTFQIMNDLFEENSLIDWVPQAPMYMYHGDADVTVPYQNSVDSFDELIANGASQSVVTFTTLPGFTHGTGFIPYVEDFLPIILDAEGL